MAICLAAPKLHLKASSCIPFPLRDETKERPCGTLKLSPFLKILVLFKESLRDLKCFHSLFEYCRRYRILASENLTTASEDVKENIDAPIVTNSPRHPGNIPRAFVSTGSSMFSLICSSAIF